MTDITIPPEALEAAARAAMKDNGCGLTVDGKHVLCCDPVCVGLTDAYGKPLFNADCGCFSMARAACLAMLEAWPGGYSLAENDSADIRDVAVIILPLTESTND
tara:strand:- start:146 stop:457 length:312 start_codon:yes stop_codon:yes gene_type:complete